MPLVFVGAGSNLEPAARLREAVVALERAFADVRCSHVYRSAAEGSPAPEYLNVVTAFATERAPDDVKLELRAIEEAAGRTRGSAQVALDLDLLMYGTRVDALRRLPHPDALRREFVLVPLAELAPEMAHPLTGEWFAAARRRLLARARRPIVDEGTLEALL